MWGEFGQALLEDVWLPEGPFVYSGSSIVGCALFPVDPPTSGGLETLMATPCSDRG